MEPQSGTVAMAAFVQLLRLLREPLLLADQGGTIVAANIAAADSLATSIATLEGATFASFAPALTDLGDRMRNGASFPLHARDGRRLVCEPSVLAPGVFLLRISGGPDAESRSRGFFETLSRLQGITSGISDAQPLEDICRTLLTEGMRSLGAVAGGVYLIDDTGAQLELKASVAYPPAYVDRYRLVPLSAPIPLTDAVKRQVTVLLGTSDDYLTQYREFTLAFPDVALRGMACVPLELDGQPLGVIGMGFPLGQIFDDEARSFLRALALQCAHVLHRTRQLDADRATRGMTDRSGSQLAVLYAFTEALARAITPGQVAEAVVDTGMAATTARAGGLWLLSDDGVTVTLTRNAGPTGPRSEAHAGIPLEPSTRFPILDAIARGTPVWLESCRQMEDRYPEAFRAFSAGGESSLACIPMFAQGRCIGGLAFNYDRARAFLEDERSFLQLIGWHAAQALERSRLYASEQNARREAETNQRRSAFLADSGMILSSSLDYPSTLASVARAAVPHVADWCIVELEEERLRGVPAVAAHIDPTKEQLVLEISRRFRALGMERGIPGVIRSGKAELYPSLSPEMLRDAFRDDPTIGKAYVELGIVASMVVPISARGRTLGAILLNSANPARLYGEGDLAMAEELGRRAGIAVDNARLYREAREADRLKDEFLAILSHELRNPLAPIVTALDVMKLRDRAVFTHEREIISRNIQQVLRLVGDLLDVARITHGKLTLKTARCELTSVITKAVEMTSPVIAERGHRLTVSTPSDSLPVLGDEARLAQTIANLLTNAAKYTEPGGSIELSAAAVGATTEIRVRDSGIGIPEHMLPRIFEPFVQDQRTLEGAQGGLGIGLTVVKSIVGLHGGTVSAHSAGPGLGSEIVIHLPIAPAEVPAFVDVSTAAMSSAVLEAGERLRVLVVDDNVDATEMLHIALGALGCVARVAHDGASALVAAAELEPDLALLDIGLPVMNGYELAGRLRSLLAARSTRIVALTGYGQESDLQRAREAGFDEHIVKPVTLEMLHEILQRAREHIPAK